jgi:hypothetical protein
MTSKYWITLFSILGISLASAHADDSRLPITQYEPSVSVTHYTAKDLNAVEKMIYEHRDGRFVPGEEFSGSNLENCFAAFLLSQQSFPLTTMMKRMGLSREDAENEVRIGLGLNHDQIAFIETTRLVPTEDWTGEVNNPNVVDLLSPPMPGFHRVKTGAFWTVAGQTLTHNPPLLVPEDLPWQKGLGAKEVAAKYYDRSKYKFVSEWGRAAQIEPGEINPLYSAAAGLDYRRLKAMGGKLEDAYVAFSTADPRNIRLYDKEYPGTRFPPGVDTTKLGMKETVFMVPLRTMLEKYPPSKYYERVAKVREISGLSETQALDLLTEAKTLDWEELTLTTSQGKTQQQRFIVIDLSRAMYSQQYKMYERFGIPQDKWNSLQEYFGKFRNPIRKKVGDERTDFSHPDNHKVLEGLNAVEISNLDGHLAETDPRFVETALLGSYSYYLKKLFGMYRTAPPSNAEIHAWIGELIRTNHHFAITTANPSMIMQAYQLSPDHILEAPVVYQDQVVKGYTFTFSVQQLQNLIKQDEAFFYHFCDSAVVPGTRKEAHLLSSNDPF